MDTRCIRVLKPTLEAAIVQVLLIAQERSWGGRLLGAQPASAFVPVSRVKLLGHQVCLISLVSASSQILSARVIVFSEISVRLSRKVQTCLVGEPRLRALERGFPGRGVKLTIWSLIALVGFIVPFMSAVHTAQATHAHPLGYVIAVGVGLVIGATCACAIFGMAKLVGSRASGEPSSSGKALLVALFPVSIGCIVLADYGGGWLAASLLRMFG